MFFLLPTFPYFPLFFRYNNSLFFILFYFIFPVYVFRKYPCEKFKCVASREKQNLGLVTS